MAVGSKGQDNNAPVGDSSEETEAGRPPSSRSYLFTLGVVCALLYLLPFALTRLPAFRARLRTFDALDYGYAQRGVDAEVVVTGDSSGFTGIDPHRLAARLGRTVVLLPDTYSTFTLTRESALRQYLRNNRPPRLVVFYGLPWDLNYSLENTPAFEGLEMMVRHGSLRDNLTYILQQPRKYLLYPFDFYFNFTPAFLLQSLLPQHRPNAVEQSGGHIAIVDRALAPGCRLPSAMMTDTSMDYTKSLLTRYKTDRTRVIAVVAPVPGCKGSDVLLDRSYAAIGAVSPSVLPPGAFVDDNWFAHPLETSVPRITDELADTIQRATQQ